jgi:hypothetical protein
MAYSMAMASGFGRANLTSLISRRDITTAAIDLESISQKQRF